MASTPAARSREPLRCTGDSAVHAFLYSGGSKTDLGTLGGSYSYGYGINAGGQVTGVAYVTNDFTAHAFRYSGGIMTDLGSLGGFGAFSAGQGINASGQIVGQFSYQRELRSARVPLLVRRDDRSQQPHSRQLRLDPDIGCGD